VVRSEEGEPLGHIDFGHNDLTRLMEHGEGITHGEQKIFRRHNYSLMVELDFVLNVVGWELSLNFRVSGSLPAEDGISQRYQSGPRLGQRAFYEYIFVLIYRIFIEDAIQGEDTAEPYDMNLSDVNYAVKRKDETLQSHPPGKHGVRNFCRELTS
jgi:hypothetical protein